jgi:large subunit ribosomal protein L23
MLSEYDCLVFPVMTEKASSSKSSGVYVFRVHPEATKIDVARSVEKVFSVKVSKVNVLNRGGKVKTFRGKRGLTGAKRFAVVRLAEGSIDLEGGI